MQRAQILVVFDLDGTLTPHKSVWEYIHRELGTWEGRGEGHLRDWEAGRINDAEFALVDAMEWKGRHVDEIRQVVGGIPILPGAREVVDFLKDKGCRVIILSSGLDVLAGRVADELGITEHYSNKLVVAKDGILTGRDEYLVPISAKGEVLEKIQASCGIGPDDTIAIGDGSTDIPMFQRAAVSFAINDAGPETIAAATHHVKNLAELKYALHGIFRLHSKPSFKIQDK